MITDDSGGRTEIVYSARDLDLATAGIGSELSQQVPCRVRFDPAQRRTVASDRPSRKQRQLRGSRA